MVMTTKRSMMHTTLARESMSSASQPATASTIYEAAMNRIEVHKDLSEATQDPKVRALKA
jgi:hypothetical protein